MTAEKKRHNTSDRHVAHAAREGERETRREKDRYQPESNTLVYIYR